MMHKSKIKELLTELMPGNGQKADELPSAKLLPNPMLPAVVRLKDKVVHGKKWMPAMYVAYFGIIEKLSNEYGYALCVHGSVNRDFDLIAVPFDVDVKPHEDLLLAIRKIVGVEESSDKVFDIVGYEPHGRMCYTIECGGGGYFDISFTPSMQQATKKVKEDMQREFEIKNLFAKMDDVSTNGR